MDNNYNNGQNDVDQNVTDNNDNITGYIDGPDPNAQAGQQNGYQNGQQGGYQNSAAPYGQGYQGPNPYGQPGYQNGPNPYGQPGFQNPNYYGPQNPYGAPGYGQDQGGSGMAVASMVLGIIAFLGVCCYPVSLLLAIIGLILGGVAIKKNTPGKGMAIAGLILSLISLSGAIILIILALSAGSFAAWENLAMFIR